MVRYYDYQKFRFYFIYLCNDSKKGLNSYPILIKYLYKGLDRILLLILAFSTLFVKIDIISILEKIFNIEIK